MKDMNQHLHNIAIAWAIQVRTLEILAGRIFDIPIADTLYAITIT
jgi:hypothetical protein